ncbi:MAG: 1-acyl-sn-glycerol-3-phosphate acyltransferase, partial [SAR324 cluster bacterium]|nr:1-acyl-sn-glycerol-3-phosphate acyltransferase [SAR324 cluster bacterium]
MCRKILALLAHFLLSLRYKVELKGIECLKGKRGALILPNHPAEIDPVILTVAAWRYIKLRPLVLEKYYFLKWVHAAMKLIQAIPVPDMDTEPGPNKRRRVFRAMEQTINAIKAGENILLYPAGSVTKAGRERLGGSSGVYTILQSSPNVPIILVRTRGLYGSIFSKALTGGVSPDFLVTLWQGFKILLSNLIILAPRREVRLEFEELPEDFPRKGSLVEQNRWLEQWYDKDGGEQISLISRKFWKKELPGIPKVKIPEVDLSEVDSDVIDEVVRKIADLSRNPVENIHLNSRLGDDLGLDSLDA